MFETKEKATALSSSVGADEMQSLSKNYNNSIPEKEDKIKDSFDVGDEVFRDYFFQQMVSKDYLHTLSHSELLDKAFPPREQIIKDFLCAGTYLFAGAPKVGKSFFMAQLAYHVSSGIPLWEYPISKGTVLYLALEDNYARLQKRLSHMFGTDSVEGLHFATQAKNLTDGLEGQIENFVSNHTDTKLIIIDTLQKVRELGGEKYSYASDYDIVTKLKKFSDEHNICVLLVHHTRKQTAEDSFETISGTNGLLGAADGAFIMQKEKRTDNNAVLEIVGRDQQDQRLHLLFKRENCIWELTKSESELWKEPPEPLLEAVAKLITVETPIWSGSASDLLALLSGFDMQPNVLTRKLNVNADRLWNEYSIELQTSRTNSGRQVKLSLKDGDYSDDNDGILGIRELS